ncbi:TLDc [Musa troglodytarum]|uniref:TLDc n=1 Tax=Musa troglodytarum TaxID=320322 RepID=A0A9E7EVC8_9LILI|nr:TLDc [Musa troglodytarum]
MISWKEKVAAKLSRLLADSPSSPSSASADYSPVASSEPEEMFSQQYVSPKKFSLPSQDLSFPNSTSGGVDANAQNSPANWRRGVNFSSHSSLPRRWKTKCLAQKDRPSDCTEESGTGFESEELPESTKESMDHFPKRLVNVSRVLDETSSTLDPREYLSYLTEKSTFMSADLFEFFQSCLPNIVKGCQWVLLYRAAHGNMGYRFEHFFVTVRTIQDHIVGDMQGAVFGGLLDSPLKPTAKRNYQGTSQTFVFTTTYGEPRLFRATGTNRFYYLCLDDMLAFGGGGHFALSLDEDLLHGTSGPCETFGSLCLAHNPEFELKNVEICLLRPYSLMHVRLLEQCRYASQLL